jgi:hypothetical protein
VLGPYIVERPWKKNNHVIVVKSQADSRVVPLLTDHGAKNSSSFGNMTFEATG